MGGGSEDESGIEDRGAEARESMRGTSAAGFGSSRIGLNRITPNKNWGAIDRSCCLCAKLDRRIQCRLRLER